MRIYFEYLQVLERAMFHFENVYRIPVTEVYGYVCKTNLPSNTAFRGFGGPQGMFLGENIIRQIADYLKLDVAKVMLFKGNFSHLSSEKINSILHKI